MNGVVRMALPMTAGPGENNADRHRVARIRDYWLGGTHNSEQDRVYANHVAMVAPHIPYLVRAQRALLGRIVRYLLGQGIRQFLDLGSGLPAQGHVHELTRDHLPPARVVYVDNDPGVAADGRLLLAGNGNAGYLEMDFLRPTEVLADPLTRRLLDLDEPVALLAIATMQQVPDSADPALVIAGYLDALAPGSYLAMTHHGPDEYLTSALETFAQMNLGPRPSVYLRDSITMRLFFTGLELAEPGIVPVPLWRPEPEDEDARRHPERTPIHVGVGRKP
ncbi:MAG TPA: SAM-dependent methyltransferase [Actinophytocola sp.]|uniref:SAM-dependent methyltransferase n=1 Tax=Actinophytocola sp. TaxID=1872138 RepID=UPI002DC05C88|nr:SAM-dependent methyltransferase [Actinophytocola sp.]HEU5472284.1 SAM-dependent methyltransferase [Actinophytocola sp.]